MKTVCDGKIAVFGLAVLLLLAVSAYAAVEPSWKISFDDEIKWQQLTPVGNLIVSTDKALYSVDPTSGKIAWQSEELKKLKQEFFDLIPMTPYAVINLSEGFMGQKGRTMLFDIWEGKSVWDSKAIGIVNSLGHFILWDTGQILMYGSDAEKLPKKDVKIVVVADLLTGKPAWKSEDFFEKDPLLHETKIGRIARKYSISGNQMPVFDTPTTFITFMSKKGVKKYDATNGSLLWQCPENMKNVSALQFGFAQMALSQNDDVIYVPYERKLYGIRASDGGMVWAKPPKLKGIVNQIMATDKGVLVRGGPDGKGKGDAFITLLDAATGEEAWKKPFKKMKGATNFVLKDGKIILYTDGKLYTINLVDGSYDELVKKVKFDGSEIPSGVSVREDGYLMTSSQNLMLADFQGNEKYHAYFKAPGSSLFAKIASTAATMAVNAMEYAVAQDRANRTGRSQKYQIHGNPTLSKRFKATGNTQNYTYILTNVKTDGDKGPGLVKVNKNTGEVEKQVILGTKKPEYEMDEVEARLFFQSDKKEITCYDF